ncbi:hypothetical protein QQZ08_000958 [Neonectria magnoliae]|uniref:Nucleotidyl transferase AbiEii/AbiGii toxin family protein n=1 Tax=Neonectria magnoliae TaxID=2732573 RepID=A0ABR1IGV7_9HYPO
MSQPTTSPALTALELSEATAILTRYMSQSAVRFSISGGAAALLLRIHYDLPLRLTEDIDLVVQPTGTVTAESISAWLLKAFPTTFIATTVYGVDIPTLAFQRPDGSFKYVEIEMFDVDTWPSRPQYDLENPDNDVTLIPVHGVDVPVFSARWLLREKIVTAFERQESLKGRTDLDDACALLKAVEMNVVDLTNHEDAVRHIHTVRPEAQEELELKVICPSVLGQPWAWNELAGVYWRFKEDQLRYLDEELQSHRFEWDPRHTCWYFNLGEQVWDYREEREDIILRE